MHIRRHPFHRHRYARWPLLLVSVPQRLHDVAEPICPSSCHPGIHWANNEDGTECKHGICGTEGC